MSSSKPVNDLTVTVVRPTEPNASVDLEERARKEREFSQRMSGEADVIASHWYLDVNESADTLAAISRSAELGAVLGHFLQTFSCAPSGFFWISTGRCNGLLINWKFEIAVDKSDISVKGSICFVRTLLPQLYCHRVWTALRSRSKLKLRGLQKSQKQNKSWNEKREPKECSFKRWKIQLYKIRVCWLRSWLRSWKSGDEKNRNWSQNFRSTLLGNVGQIIFDLTWWISCKLLLLDTESSSTSFVGPT